MKMLSLDEIQRLIDPPPATFGIPGIGGTLRSVPEDFRVREIPANYPNDSGRAHSHLLLWKRGWTTTKAVEEIADQLGIPLRDIGYAGKKDSDAVTEQWISIPARCVDGVARFRHAELRLSLPRPRARKLRIGDHGGNEFDIVIRNLAVPADEALERVERKLTRMRELGGLWNFFGPQRFGGDAKHAWKAICALPAGDEKPLRDPATIQAQAVLFHLYLLLRIDRRWVRTVRAGDVLQKRGTDGFFICTEPSIDQTRLDKGEIDLTGPIFGRTMRSPAPGSEPASLEREILGRAGIPPEAFRQKGFPPGARRPLQAPVPEVTLVVMDGEMLQESAPDACCAPALRLRFTLPPGGFATVFLRELQG